MTRRPTTATRLRAAADLVATGWCKYHNAEALDGTNISPWHPAARRFCAVGAIQALTPRPADPIGAANADPCILALDASIATHFGPENVPRSQSPGERITRVNDLAPEAHTIIAWFLAVADELEQTP